MLGILQPECQWISGTKVGKPHPNCLVKNATIAHKEVLTLAEKKTHPYTPSGAGGITSAVTQFRSNLPQNVNAQTLKKFGIAPNNESYIINILRFVGVIDDDGERTERATTIFAQDDTDFQKEFGEMVKTAYSELFHLYNEAAWDLPDNKLISFFRTTDQTSSIVGQRQANTFRALASLAGHGAPPAPPKPKQAKETKAKPGATSKPKEQLVIHPPNGGEQQPRDFGLTVRVEVNLPPDGTQDTYDRIFRSIRENLLNGK